MMANPYIAGSVPFGGLRLVALELGIYSVVGVMALVVTYMGALNGIAYLGNPLRGARRRVRASLAERGPEGFGLHDVSLRARKNRNTALLRFTVQIIGVGIAASGAQIYLRPHWYIYLLIGLPVVWAAGRFIHPAGVNRDKGLGILDGSHRFRAVSLLSVSSAMFVTGLAIILVISENTTLGGASAQARADNYWGAGFILLIVGALGYRGARRLASVEARRLMLRDSRPPVLYLRWFGDDDLKLRSATLGRRSLVERFSPVRFDSFEEMLARHLSRFGPVIAINPPGTKLSPLGAARDTITSTDWQSAVATWMARASLIVFVAPPESVTPGLLWELQAVSASRYWDKTLILVPPVLPDDLLSRWQVFLRACGRLWPFTITLPSADPRALVLAFRNNKWTLIVADWRSEWSYGAAVKQALDASPQSARFITVRCQSCGRDTKFSRSVIELRPLPRCGHCNHEMRIRSQNDAVAHPESAVVKVRCGACGHNTQLPRALVEPQPLPRCGNCNKEMRIRAR
jgi:ribosomal protein S27E